MNENGEAFDFTFDIENVLPYLSPEGSDDFSIFCSSLMSEYLEGFESCKSQDGCPASNDLCTERMEFLASRHIRLATFWNETMANYGGGDGNKKGFGIAIGETGLYRRRISEYVAQKRILNPNYKVLDVGGLGGQGWSWTLIDAVLDFKPPPDDLPKSVQSFTGDITRASGWRTVLDHVAIHGKFDLVICTHTLEDLLDPQLVLEHLPMVAKAGQLAVPSRIMELSRLVSGPAYERLGFNEENGLAGNNFRGFLHHFWVFTVVDGQVVGVPKSPILEEDFYEKNGMVYDGGGIGGIEILNSYGELNLWWEEEIESWEELPLKLFNSGFGEMQEAVGLPTTGFYSAHVATLHAYRELIQGDDLNIFNGVIATIRVNVEGKGVKTLRLLDNERISKQVEAFCEQRYPEVDCVYLNKKVEKVLDVSELETFHKRIFQEMGLG
eukprot:CAMPEP_0118653040 /NCGR_PEP_ID=MMETSP0785-20121206/11629_1 /TAXON_ID=91992 /ORGANISM="Bolidomonas pacifica, Strain CCMP 1866" /LENGTH=438 /DNA_ID=CAMNT_0006545577 /DNA_START=117 /DNA_END=1430 /DNA_ORIENTATION=-